MKCEFISFCHKLEQMSSAVDSINRRFITRVKSESVKPPIISEFRFFWCHSRPMHECIIGNIIGIHCLQRLLLVLQPYRHPHLVLLHIFPLHIQRSIAIPLHPACLPHPWSPLTHGPNPFYHSTWCVVLIIVRPRQWRRRPSCCSLRRLPFSCPRRPRSTCP